MKAGAQAGSAQWTSLAGLRRPAIAFRAINRCGDPGYEPDMQRHHLLPRALLQARCFEALFAAVGHSRIGFDDFRSNGLLLPAADAAAHRLRLPLHRGPHARYNAMVAERVGQIEREWAVARQRSGDRAREAALMRLCLLQRALRRRLLAPARLRSPLNRGDPQRAPDFSELDALADTLWRDCAEPPPGPRGYAAGLTAPLAADRIARTLAVAISSSMPTPHTIRPSGSAHSR